MKCTGPDPKTLKTKNRSFFTVEAGKTTLSCSGFVAANNVVITSAWLLAPFINENSNYQQLIYDTKIDCCGEDGISRQAELVKIWKCPADGKLSAAVRDLTGNDDELSIRGITQTDIAVLSCDTTGLASVNYAGFFQAKAIDRGTNLYVVSSAFGLVSPTVFRNSVTRGVLSNVVIPSSGSITSSNPELCLTDARCLAGSEGGPVFDSKNRFLGMVLPGFVRKDGMPLELGVILPYHQFWDECIGKPHGNAVISPLASTAISMKRTQALAVPSKAAQGVALLRVGANWGSGVLIYKNPTSGDGLVLTCAHVVRSNVDSAEAISVSFRGTAQTVERVGVIKFCCEGPVDIAFVSVPRLPSWLDPAVLVTDTKEFRDGDVVSAVGHAIFEPSGLLGRNATISTGTLSKVVPHNGKPALLQTCAQVFRGHSGGMICDEKGRLLGIITSNAKHSDGSIIPEINFAVPLSFISDLIKPKILNDKTNADFKKAAMKFDENAKTSNHLKMLWALQPVESTEAPRIGGGSFYSFFAKFLMDKSKL